MDSLTPDPARIQEAEELYRRANVALATAAGLLVQLVADRTLSPAEGIHRLTAFVNRYNSALSALGTARGEAPS